MSARFTLPKTTDNTTFLYQLVDQYWQWLEQHGDNAMDSFTDEQHTLMAYIYLDSQVQEGGFLQLVATGFGEYIFNNPLADSLRRWKIKATPKAIESAYHYYQTAGSGIEQAAETETNLDTLRRRFNGFEESDADYFDAAETDLDIAKEYVLAHPEKFTA